MSMFSGPAAAPKPVVQAFWLSVANGVGGAIFAAVWPDLDERGTVFGVSVVIGALLIGLAWSALRGLRWGGYAAIAANAISVLLGIPGFFEGDTGFIIGAAISIVLSAATIYCLWLPEARAYWQRSA